MPGIGAIGPIGALPGLPSPAMGVPATPDVLTNLIQNGPAAAQGFQQGQEEKFLREQRKMQLAQQRLDTYAPIALQNSKNPAAAKAIQQSFKDLGLDPSLALNPDGTVNTSALQQYSPYFKMITSPGFAFLPPAVQTGIWQQAFPGSTPPSFVGQENINPKEATALLSTVRTAITTGDMPTLAATAQTLAKIPGYEQLGASLVTQAQSGHLNPKLASQIASATSLDQLRSVEGNYIAGPKTAVAGSIVGVNQARIPNIQSSTKKNVADLSLIQSEIRKNDAQATAALQNANTAAQRLGVELQRLNVTNIGHAITAADAYNKNIADLRHTQNSLQATIQRYITSGQAYLPNQRDANGQPVPQPDFAKAQQQLQQVTATLGKLKPIDLSKITQAALHNSGMPNTMKFIETPQGGQQSSMVVTRQQLQAIATKYHKPLAQVIKDYENRGYTVH